MFSRLFMSTILLSFPGFIQESNNLQGLIVSFCFHSFQRLNQSTNVEAEVGKLTQTATLQAAPTARDRKSDTEKRKTTTKVILLEFEHSPAFCTHV